MVKELKKNNDKIALERISILFDLAKKELDSGREDLANRYVYIARKIAMKFNLSLDDVFKRQFCKKCGSFWVIGKNVTKRIKKGLSEYTCHKCGSKRRL